MVVSLTIAVPATSRFPHSFPHRFCPHSSINNYSTSFLWLNIEKNTLVIIRNAYQINFWLFEIVTPLVDEVEDLTEVLRVLLKSRNQYDNKLALDEKILHILLVVVFRLCEDVPDVVLYHAEYFLRVRKIFKDKCMPCQLQLC